jgi:hypothetical protein
MNVAFRAGGILALAVTLAKIASKFWQAAPEVVKFVASNSSFFLGMAFGIAVAGLTRNLWAILLAITAGFIILKWVGI